MAILRCIAILLSSAFAALLLTFDAALLPRALGSERVDFEADIGPILQAKCVRCHGPETRKGELDLSSDKALMRGGESGPIVQQDAPEESRLLEVVGEGEMPPEGEGEPLTAEESSLLRRWILQLQTDGTPAEIRPPGGPSQHTVLPILLGKCATCHGRQTREGGLDVRHISSLLRGGKTGPAIVLGDPKQSLLIQRIRSAEMPPRDKLAKYSVKPVDAGELQRLEAWIAASAPWIDVPADVPSTEGDPLVSDADREYWAFQPPRAAAPPLDGPRVRSGSRTVENTVDAFIIEKLTDKGLALAPRADRWVLIRRLYLDLIGLPPSADEVLEFVSDDHPQAYERLVDRLLASPAYGERWGQHWLDLAGYSDSEGVQHSDPIRPHAYRYRDYVIRAFNADKSYDRFLLEQIAGDELADYETAEEITEEIYDNLVATGFLRMSSDGTFAGITGFLPNRLDVIDDQIRVLSSAVMGLTMRCARCHSHKFDPIPQRDYYRLASVFKGAMDEFDWLKPLDNPVGASRYLPHVTARERRQWEIKDDALRNRIGHLQKRREASRNDAESSALDKRIKELESRRTPEPKIRALWDVGEPSPTYLLRRGDYRQPSRVVGPGVPSVLTDGRTPFVAEPPWPNAKKTGNRLAIARWLIDPKHPLTARVLVNRIWKHHFGRGLVEPLDDFGKAGGQPTHPELLDWMAIRFVERGWSIKSLHRQLVTSATYRQASQKTQLAWERDPENRLFSRMPLQRMDAEVLRDSMLAVAGKLDRTQFGPATAVAARADGLVMSKPYRGAWRRSIYVLHRRTQALTILNNFDRPAMSPNCISRSTSNVAPQALHLMNNRLVHALSLQLAERTFAECGGDRRRQIDYLFLTTTGRPPTPGQRRHVLETLNMLVAAWSRGAEEEPPVNSQAEASLDPQTRALSNVAHAMLNSAGFLYID